MWIPVYYRLLLEFELARVSTTAFYTHGAVMITIDFTNNDVVYRSSDLAPLKCLTIFKLKGKDPYRIKLNGTAPELAFEIRICPKFPTSALTMAGNNHRMMTNLKHRKKLLTKHLCQDLLSLISKKQLRTQYYHILT